MSYEMIEGIPVFGNPLQNAVDQIVNCHKDANYSALMADHHLGYAVPIGGVVAYENHISPSGVGYDIACGNKAVKLNCKWEDIELGMESIMDRIFNEISFGVGKVNLEQVDHALFDSETWKIDVVSGLKDKSRAQLGTTGSGNHYVDIFRDEDDNVWCGVHFGSRGLGHNIATHFVKAGGGTDGVNVDPVLLDINSSLGAEYIECMNLAGEYAYAGRDWVCQKVASIIGCDIIEEIHNHHNFAWRENHHGQDLWVIRKGATPCFPNQKGFVGATMSEASVILEGVESETSKVALYSTVHGAGRVMSRTQARGKVNRKTGEVKSKGLVTEGMMQEAVEANRVVLRGAGVDESPHCYKRLDQVLGHHEDTIRILHKLTPVGVAMAGKGQ